MLSVSIRRIATILYRPSFSLSGALSYDGYKILGPLLSRCLLCPSHCLLYEVDLFSRGTVWGAPSPLNVWNFLEGSVANFQTMILNKIY